MFAKVFSLSIDETPAHEIPNARSVTVHAHVAERHVAYSALATDFGGITVGLSYHGATADRFATHHRGSTLCDGSCRGETDFRSLYLRNERLHGDSGYDAFVPEAAWQRFQERLNAPWDRFQERYDSRNGLKLRSKGRLFRHTFHYDGDGFTNDWCFGTYHVQEECGEMGLGSDFRFSRCDGNCRTQRIRLPDHVTDKVRVELGPIKPVIPRGTWA